MFKKMLGAVVLFSLISAAHATDEDNIRSSLQKTLPNVKIGEIKKLPSGIYQVVGNGFNVFYTDKTGEIAFFGNMVDLKTKKNLTQEESDRLRHVDFASLPLDRAIVRVKGNGKRKLALFSDPDCPFCQKLETELKDVNDVTIYTFLLPLDIHPDSKRKAGQIWCSKDPAKAWDDWMLDKKELPQGDAKCDTPIAEIAALADKLYINGTPGLVFENGKLVPGAIPRAQIETNLADAKK